MPSVFSEAVVSTDTGRPRASVGLPYAMTQTSASPVRIAVIKSFGIALDGSLPLFERKEGLFKR